MSTRAEIGGCVGCRIGAENKLGVGQLDPPRNRGNVAPPRCCNFEARRCSTRARAETKTMSCFRLATISCGEQVRLSPSRDRPVVSRAGSRRKNTDCRTSLLTSFRASAPALAHSLAKRAALEARSASNRTSRLQTTSKLIAIVKRRPRAMSNAEKSHVTHGAWQISIISPMPTCSAECPRWFSPNTALSPMSSNIWSKSIAGGST
jgi:hypothetical protein